MADRPTDTRTTLERLLLPFRQFAATESAGGIVLLAATGLALLWANSPLAPAYHALWSARGTIGVGQASVVLTLHHWINDALMAVFFLLVGLEVKREFLFGELASARTAALPVAAAAGGMLLPAAIYAALNAGGPGAAGWGIPMATDIAFALGILALLGPRIPLGLKVFLAALAIADDIGAVLVIALFYSATISWSALGVAGALVLAGLASNRAGVRHPAAYALLGVPLWLAVHASGIHATVAGVLLAALVPARPAAHRHERSTLRRMEEALHPWVAFAIVPLFALANAGVPLRGEASLADAVPLGVVLGLVVGKPLGITAASWLAVRLGAAPLGGVGWRALHGVAWLGGIGFTMSLFIAQLAFDDAATLASAKLAILTGSAIAAAAGWLLLRGIGTGELAGAARRRAPPKVTRGSTRPMGE